MTATVPFAPRPLSDVRKDQSGAIMITGLFMSCFLIGCLWFVIGIGDTVVFRDKMQEAADVGAFSSAALQAKGMNFIALCNLVLLAAVTIHIILGIVTDIAMLICIATAIETLGAGCTFWVEMENYWRKYFDILKPAAEVIHVAEEAAAFGYPIMGLVEGMQNGKTYGGGNTSEVTVLAVGPSNIPGGGHDGLPVTAQPMNYLCVKLVTKTTELIASAIGLGGGGSVAGKIGGIIGKGIQFRYCNSLGGATGVLGDAAQQEATAKANNKIDQVNAEIDKQNANSNGGQQTANIDKFSSSGGGGGSGIDPGFNTFWGKSGPMTIFDKGANGSSYFQVYATNIAPSFNDKESESHVGIARGPSTKNGSKGMQKYTTQPKGMAYFSQAEFYFDCSDEWKADTCNNEDNATFQIKWRARMKKFSLGNGIDQVLNMGLGGLANIQGVEGFSNLAQSVTGQAGALLNGGGVMGAGQLQGVFNQIKNGVGPDGNPISTLAGGAGINGGMFH